MVAPSALGFTARFESSVWTADMEQSPLQQSIEEPISSAPPEVQMILRAVIRAEKDNLHLKKTRVKGDILKIIKTAIQ